MSYNIIFKGNRKPLRVSDERAYAVAEAKDLGKTVEIDGSFFDTTMIAEISPTPTGPTENFASWKDTPLLPSDDKPMSDDQVNQLREKAKKLRFV